MGILNWLIGRTNNDEEMTVAEDYIREQTCLYRHYCIPEVQRAVAEKGVTLSRDEATEIVQRIRDEKEMGPIEEYNR